MEETGSFPFSFLSIEGNGGGGGIEGTVFWPLVLPNMSGNGGAGGMAVVEVSIATELNMPGNGGGGGALDERAFGRLFLLLLFASKEVEWCDVCASIEAWFDDMKPPEGGGSWIFAPAWWFKSSFRR